MTEFDKRVSDNASSFRSPQTTELPDPVFSPEAAQGESYIRNLAAIGTLIVKNGVRDNKRRTEHGVFASYLNTFRNRRKKYFTGSVESYSLDNTSLELELEDHKPNPRDHNDVKSVVKLKYYDDNKQIIIGFNPDNLPEGIEFEMPKDAVERSWRSGSREHNGTTYKCVEKHDEKVRYIEFSALPGQFGPKTVAFLNGITERALAEMRAFVTIPEGERVEPEPDEEDRYVFGGLNGLPDLSFVMRPKKTSRIPFVRDLLTLEQMVLENPTDYSYGPNQEKLFVDLSSQQYEGGNYFNAHLAVEGVMGKREKRGFSVEERIIDPKKRYQDDLGFRLTIDDDRASICAPESMFPHLPDNFIANLFIVRRNGYVEIFGPAIAFVGFRGGRLHEFTKRAIENLEKYLAIPAERRYRRKLLDRSEEIRVPVIAGLPTDTTDRDIIKQQLENTMRMDQEEVAGYNNCRGKDQYIKALYGVGGFFNQVRSTGCNRIVDIGTGYGYAIGEFMQDKHYRDLDFSVTNLTHNKGLAKLPQEKVYITPAEEMEGFEPQSIGGIVGLNSIAYSVAPGLVAGRLDEILVPGGVIKATFRHPLSIDMKEYGFQTPEHFVKYWKKLGYDVEIYKGMAVVAVKPGDTKGMTAKTIIEQDLESLKRSGLEKAWTTIDRNGNRSYAEIS